LRILVSGASGLIGSAFVRVARSNGDDVWRLVRRETRSDDEVSWDPMAGRAPDPRDLDGVDAIVNLAGAGLGDRRWNAAYKREILESRLRATTMLATTAAGLARPPSVFVSASAVGYYGDTGDTPVDEKSPRGNDFLAEVCREWEAATAAASDAGIRTVCARNGIVLSTRGGALGKVLPLFRAGLGGRLGSGRQYVSWIARPDHIAALRFLLAAQDIHGAVNLTAPHPVTNSVYSKAIAAAVRRPAWFFVPSPALRLVIGEFADNVLTGQRVMPARLQAAGFEFSYPEIESALRALVESHS
jgi:uncharacterized protein (TIGR01777 family)